MFLILGILGWLVIGIFALIFCLGFWNGGDYWEQFDRNELKYIGVVIGLGPIMWFCIIIHLIITDKQLDGSGKTLHWKFPLPKSKGQKFLEKLES